MNFDEVPRSLSQLLFFVSQIYTYLHTVFWFSLMVSQVTAVLRGIILNTWYLVGPTVHTKTYIFHYFY